MRPEFQDYIEVLGGSSAKESNDVVHTLYNQHFFHAPADSSRNDEQMIEGSRIKIIEAIKRTKKEDKEKVTIFGLKPLTDLPIIIEETRSVLHDTDELFISGSYNFREVSNLSTRLNSMLNEGNYRTTVFESFFVYDKNKLPKEIMHLNDSPYKKQLDRLSDSIKEDGSIVGNIHKLSIETWNRAVSYDCIRDCITPLLKYKDKIENFDTNFLENYLNNLETTILDPTKSISQINREFIETINTCVFQEETVLTGKERFEKDYNSKFTEKFVDLNIQNFNWNWKVLCVIAEDPYETLIGDATLGVFYFHPGLFDITKGIVSRAEDKSYTSFNEEGSKNTFLITNVTDYEGFLKVLGDDLATEGV